MATGLGRVLRMGNLEIRQMTEEDIFNLAEDHGWQDDFGRWNFQDDGLLNFVAELEDKLKQKST